MRRVTLKSFGIFGGLVVITAALVYLIYGQIYGFDVLDREVHGATSVMLAGFTPAPGPIMTAPAAIPGQPQFQPAIAYPTGQQFGYSPAAWPPPVAYGLGPAAAAPVLPIQAAGQYLCQQHGAVGLPLLDQAGLPHCPVCGQYMLLNRGVQAPINTGQYAYSLPPVVPGPQIIWR